MIATYNQIDESCLIILDRSDNGSLANAVFRLLYNTGVRIQEAVQLPRFSLGVADFTIDTEKNSLNRTFPIGYLPPIYYNYLPYNPGFGGFQTISSYSTVVRQIKSFTDQIYYKGENNILTNIFRYRYARYLQHEGFTLLQIKEAFGHLSTQSTLSYLADIHF